MSVIRDTDRQSIVTRTFGCLAERPRRQLLATLEDRQGTANERELAAALAGGDSVTSSEPLDDREQIRAALRHVHLPKLVEADLLAWNETTGAVSLTDHPLNDDEQFSALLDADDAQWTALATAYGDEHRWAALTAVESASGPISRTALADAVADRVVDGDASRDRIESIGLQLHHEHLPKLDHAGLIEYDAAEDVATAGEREVPRVEPTPTAD